MGVKRRWRWIVRFTVAGAVMLCFGYVVLRLAAGYGFGFYESFQAIEPGMDESRVIELLGDPHERSAEFRLAQYEGYEDEYARAAASGSAQHLRWHKGIDVVYAVGIDKDGKVAMKAVGGT